MAQKERKEIHNANENKHLDIWGRVIGQQKAYLHCTQLPGN